MMISKAFPTMPVAGALVGFGAFTVLRVFLVIFGISIAAGFFGAGVTVAVGARTGAFVCGLALADAEPSAGGRNVFKRVLGMHWNFKPPKTPTTFCSELKRYTSPATILPPAGCILT